MRWMDNTKYRPAHSGEYLVLSRNKAFHVIKYDANNGLWNANQNKARAIEVEALAYLPTMQEIASDLRED